MILERGDKSEAVKTLQRGLNKLGLLLLVDGDFGGGTEAAVADARVMLGLAGPPRADDALLEALARRPEPSAELTAPGVSFVGREEVSSPAEYRRRYRFPTWPTEPSGITIGIGYDLAFVTPAELRADWGAVLPMATVDRLVPVLGTRGSQALLAQVKDVEVPLPAAMSVFLGRMMPKHVRATRTAYPMLDRLSPARRTALISLVFNRGGDLDGGDRRIEMKRIRELLAEGQLDAVAQQFAAMERHWDPARERGVIERRRREAMLWRDGFAALQLD
jgi:peptidoglycan hydrolase-like protein with peptidoglycan-binding domain